MREIKFRAWDTKRNVLLYDLSPEIFIGIEGRIWEEHSDGATRETWYEETYDYIPMQYTGLEDKNGKEIYEGDILINSRMKADSKDEKARFVIEWDNDYSGFILKGVNVYSNAYREGIVDESAQWGKDKLNVNWVSEIKIIGNIYETPELLK